jgi:hypothetical protein
VPKCTDESNPACLCTTDSIGRASCTYHDSCLDLGNNACTCTDLGDASTCTIDASCSGDLSTCAAVKTACDSNNPACICSASGSCELAASCSETGNLACVCTDLSDASTCQVDQSCGGDISSCAAITPPCTDPTNPACICAVYGELSSPSASTGCQYHAACLDDMNLACSCGDITDPSTCVIDSLCTSQT